MNKKNLRQNGEKGITLIALVITIIVMLILVGVTISMAVNGGLFEYAGKAVSETNNTLKAEGQLAEGGIEVGEVWYNNIDEYLEVSKREYISDTESCVGCYADVDGDGTVDGVIYADLAVGNTKDGQWTDNDGNYIIPTETGLKNYYVIGTADGVFGNGVEVITSVKNGEGKDRFYVMALEDISESTYTWYKSKAEVGITVQTSTGFETGKTNTVTMVTTWNADTDESKNSNDVWGVIQDIEGYDIVETANDSGKWFLPSKEEWSAFAEELGISSGKYSDFGLSNEYMSSSLDGSKNYYRADFQGNGFDVGGIHGTCYVRLSTTF